MRDGKGRLVVTGASGFIGVRLVAAALAEGWNVTALVRDPSSLAPLNCAMLRAERWTIGQGLVRDILSGADALLHLAAFVPPDHENPAYAAECFRVNALGTLELAQQASEANVGRFVLFSSGQIYSPANKIASESASVYPDRRATYYLSSKLNAELFLHNVSYKTGLAISVLRVGSVYGSGMPASGLMPIFMKRILEGRVVDVLDGGTYAVDFVYVNNVVDAALSVVRTKANGIINIGSGQARTSLDVANVLVKILKGDPTSIKLHERCSAFCPTGFPALDIGRAREAFSYRPSTLEEGLHLWLST